MRRNYSLRTGKFSLFFVGAGAGLLSLAPATHAQTMLLPLVDSTAFNQDANNQTAAPSVIEPKVKRLQPLKFAVDWTPLQPIELPKKDSEVSTADLSETATDHSATQRVTALVEEPETVIHQANLAFLRKPIDIDAPPTPMTGPLSKLARINPNALLQPIDVSPRKPMDIQDPSTLKLQPLSKLARINSSALLQPIDAPRPTFEPVDEQVSSTNAPKYDRPTPLPSGPISLFVDGPDYLRTGQVGEYEIAIANSASVTKTVSKISLQVPIGAEIIEAERDPKTSHRERTVTWFNDQIASGKQRRIRFRVKMTEAGAMDLAVTIFQDHLESQTISQKTIVR